MESNIREYIILLGSLGGIIFLLLFILMFVMDLNGQLNFQPEQWTDGNMTNGEKVCTEFDPTPSCNVSESYMIGIKCPEDLTNLIGIYENCYAFINYPITMEVCNEPYCADSLNNMTCPDFVQPLWEHCYHISAWHIKQYHHHLQDEFDYCLIYNEPQCVKWALEWGITTDNRLSNLQLFKNQAKHAYHHKTGEL